MKSSSGWLMLCLWEGGTNTKGPVRVVHSSPDDLVFVHEDTAYRHFVGIQGRLSHFEGGSHEASVQVDLIGRGERSSRDNVHDGGVEKGDGWMVVGGCVGDGGGWWWWWWW